MGCPDWAWRTYNQAAHTQPHLRPTPIPRKHFAPRGVFGATPTVCLMTW